MENALLRLDIDNNVATLEREKENILTEIRNAQNNIKTDWRIFLFSSRFGCLAA